MGGRGSSGKPKGKIAAANLTIDGKNILESVQPYIGKYKYIGIRTQEEKRRRD